ncbi:RDD family protein [Bacillus sp. 2205SS5-2]|uniref:RDD family protein n=1 Tax=Bacillus sp. 2205SS5-2 TaxID=3109031 RepID=UPI003005A7BF
MQEERVDIVTPEYVPLQFQTAGLGSRAAAHIIDQLLLTVINILMIVIFILTATGEVSVIGLTTLSSYLIGFFIVLIFLINWGYFFALEYFWGGKTVGKRLIGIVVIQENGHSITLLSSFIRNLLRLIDSLPTAYFLGIAMIFLHSKHKRMGDIVAGTIVVHERRLKRKHKASAIEKDIQQRGLSKENLSLENWQIQQFVQKDWNLLNSYSNRLLNLTNSQRLLRTKQMAQILFPKIGLEVDGKAQIELENTLLILYLVLKDEWEFEV